MIADIIRIEADGGYSVFYTYDGQKYMVSKNLKEYEDNLPAADFLRVHKSHVVNMHKVKRFTRTDGYFVEMEDGSLVEISRRKKDEFLQRMAGLYKTFSRSSFFSCHSFLHCYHTSKSSVKKGSRDGPSLR